MSMTGRVATYAPDMTDSGPVSHRSSEPDRPGEPYDWRKGLFGRDSFFPVLLIAILTIILSPMIEAFRFGFVIVYPASALLVLLAFHRSQVRRRTITAITVLLIVVGIMALITSIARIVDVTDDRYLIAASSFMFAVLTLCAFPVVVRRAFHHERVSLNTLAAGITAYLLIGIFFASMYRCDSALENFGVFQQTIHPSAGDYTYFSFITLTTVGYGDFTPATDVARSLAIFEAILGQVFLITAVARIVSLLGSDRPATFPMRPRHDFSDGPQPD